MVARHTHNRNMRDSGVKTFYIINQTKEALNRMVITKMGIVCSRRWAAEEEWRENGTPQIIH